MREIYLLVDYKNQFGSKKGAVPYRSGLDRRKLSDSFREFGLDPIFCNFCDVDFRDSCLPGRHVLYTSSEDYGLHYKSFIEDVVLGLEILGARLIPPFRFLRAHHNKIFMEILRDQMTLEMARRLKSGRYGTLEEWLARSNDNPPPCVVKPSAGSMSRGVQLCRTAEELRRTVARVSVTRSLGHDAWDWGRSLRRPGYLRESKYRRKFLVQRYLTGVENDWKILVFGSRYFALLRHAKKGDFRASGSGRFEFIQEVPHGVLDFAESVFQELGVPHLSLDIGSSTEGLHLFEFQALYFGSLTLERSPFYFVREASGWSMRHERSDLEHQYVAGVADHILRQEKSSDVEAGRTRQQGPHE